MSIGSQGPRGCIAKCTEDLQTWTESILLNAARHRVSIAEVGSRRFQDFAPLVEPFEMTVSPGSTWEHMLECLSEGLVLNGKAVWLLRTLVGWCHLAIQWYFLDLEEGIA